MDDAIGSDHGLIAVGRIRAAGHQAFQIRDAGGDAERRGGFREDRFDGLLKVVRGHLHARVKRHHGGRALHGGIAAHVHRAADGADVAEDDSAVAGEREFDVSDLRFAGEERVFEFREQGFRKRVPVGTGSAGKCDRGVQPAQDGFTVGVAVIIDLGQMRAGLSAREDLVDPGVDAGPLKRGDGRGGRGEILLEDAEFFPDLRVGQRVGLVQQDVDGIDGESWSDENGNPRYRIEQQERWFHYVTEELLPEYRPWERKALVTGCSMGGVHAGNFFFRRPDLFDGMVSMSGLFNAQYFFHDYMDDLVYANSPVHFLPNMPYDHPWMQLYRESRIILCCGQGAWEEDLLYGTRELDRVLSDKGIPHWADYWGFDVAHDWNWWQKQLPYFLGKLGEDGYFG